MYAAVWEKLGVMVVRDVAQLGSSEYFHCQIVPKSGHSRGSFQWTARYSVKGVKCKAPQYLSELPEFQAS